MSSSCNNYNNGRDAIKSPKTGIGTDNIIITVDHHNLSHEHESHGSRPAFCSHLRPNCPPASRNTRISPLHCPPGSIRIFLASSSSTSLAPSLSSRAIFRLLHPPSYPPAPPPRPAPLPPPPTNSPLTPGPAKAKHKAKDEASRYKGCKAKRQQ